MEPWSRSNRKKAPEGLECNRPRRANDHGGSWKALQYILGRGLSLLSEEWERRRRIFSESGFQSLEQIHIHEASFQGPAIPEDSPPPEDMLFKVSTKVSVKVGLRGEMKVAHHSGSDKDVQVVILK